MPTYKVNAAGIAKARQMIQARQYDLTTPWSDAAPSPEEGSSHIERHGYESFGEWHLAIDEGASRDTKQRYAFPYGDFRRVSRAGLIHAKQRASQNGHEEIAKAAGELLDELDRASAG